MSQMTVPASATELVNLQSQRIGYIAVSLTEWDTTSIPQMAEGSLIEVLGALAEAQGGDLDVGNLAALADGICYLLVESDGTLSASVTAPEWVAAKYGWYDVATGSKRCYGQLLKAGASYTQKTIYLSEECGIISRGIIIGIFADADRVIRFSTDSSIMWDESEDKFLIDKDLSITSDISIGGDQDVTGEINCNTLFRNTSSYIHVDSPTRNQVFDAIAPAIPNVNDFIPISGGHISESNGNIYVCSRVKRTSSSTITIYSVQNNNTLDSEVFTNGDGSYWDGVTSLCW